MTPLITGDDVHLVGMDRMIGIVKEVADEGMYVFLLKFENV